MCRNFSDMVVSCLERLPRTEFGLFMTICWAVWTAKNKGLFEGEGCDPQNTMSYVYKLMEE